MSLAGDRSIIVNIYVVVATLEMPFSEAFSISLSVFLNELPDEKFIPRSSSLEILRILLFNVRVSPLEGEIS